MWRRVAVLCSVVWLAGAIDAAASEADRKELLQGVTHVERLGVPGTLCVFGPQAFAVLTANDKPEPVVAAVHTERTRVVAWAHGSYLTTKALRDTEAGAGRLFANAVAWAVAGTEQRIKVLGGEELWPVLERLGYKRPDDKWAPQGWSKGYDLLIWTPGGAQPKPEQVLRFLRAGGALLCAHCPWGWAQSNSKHGATLRDDLPENRVLRHFDLVFAAGYADATAKKGFAVARSLPEFAHAGDAFDEIVKQVKGAHQRAYLAEKLLRSLPIVPATELDRFRARLGQLDASRAPHPDRPLRRADALNRLRVTDGSLRWRELARDEVGPAPGVEHFPGTIGEGVARETKTVTPDPAVAGRQSFGLYLPPGEVMTITAESVPRGWRVRVGAHSDRLWNKDRWSRWPEITEVLDLAAVRTRVVTPWGGTIYLERIDERAQAVELTMAGVVASPRFVLGETTPEQWKAARAAPGPWAELEGAHMVLSVPSAAIRDYDDPGALMQFWDSVLASHCVLAGIPIPARRERFVADVQISAGYMHSGYPIMMHLDQVEPAKGGGLPPLLDLAALRTKGSWGCFHELGHNRQRRWWTFRGTGEVTCNWFSLFTGERVCGIDPWRNPWLENQKPKVAKHLAAGAPFDRWTSQPGLALMTYAQVQRKFGWKPFMTVIARYEAMPAKQRPKGDSACIDEWVRRLSLAAGRDLRAFHVRWGWPLSPALLTDAALGALEPWNPDPADLAHFDALTPPK